MPNAITYTAECIDPGIDVGSAAVPIAMSTMVAARVVGLPPSCFLVIVLFVLLVTPVLARTASWRLPPVLS
jgi:hypothetical protein